MHAVTENVVWASAYDGTNPTAANQEFTRTVDGGNTWLPGIVNYATGLSNAMLFALNSDTAFIPMYRVSGSKPQGIYNTFDAGVNRICNRCYRRILQLG
ncbi:MAG: hypothetical protein FJY10_05790 [Bacteroidetes bacterium]|nr:hypothetical protein [Bacteroidota bacterium]